MSHLSHRLDVTEAMREAARRSVSGLRDAVGQARDRAGGDAFVLAWLGDLHLHARRPYPHLGAAYAEAVDTSANLELALCEVNALAPLVDLLVLGGDLADSGCGGEAPADEYAELGRLLDAHLPADLDSLPICGNHDHADAPLSPGWHAAFGAIARPGWPVSEDGDDYYFVARRGGWRIIGLDTRQGQPLSDRQRQWLAARFEEEIPTVLLMHRPFLSVGNWVDEFRLHDRPSFDLVDSAECVRLVLSGHTHMTGAWTYRGKHHVVFPATAYGIPDPIGWGLVVFGGDRVAAVYTKDIAVPAYWDSPADVITSAPPAWRPLAFRAYEKDKLFNPCLMPR